MSSADRVYFSDKYSLEEECIGSLWVDGKMIYRKTIDVGYITGTSPKVISHGIIDIDNIIKFEGFAKLDSGYTVNIPHVSTTEVQGVNIGANKTEIRLYHNYDNIDQYYAYVTIYYTKV